MACFKRKRSSKTRNKFGPNVLCWSTLTTGMHILLMTLIQASLIVSKSCLHIASMRSSVIAKSLQGLSLMARRIFALELTFRFSLISLAFLLMLSISGASGLQPTGFMRSSLTPLIPQSTDFNTKFAIGLHDRELDSRLIRPKLLSTPWPSLLPFAITTMSITCPS